ncbi:MAG: glutathione S-transferase family protein [Pseudomonadota bacterium]
MSGYILYGYPASGSGAVEVALVAANIPFEMKDLDPDAGELESEAFLAINPRGQVPTLIHPDGSVITEVPAILLHLADAHPGCGLAPQPGSSARAQHDRWLAFAHANCYEGVLRVFYSDRYTTDPAQAEPVSKAALAYVIRHLNMMADGMGTGPFMFGEYPMAVDYLVWIMTTWLVDEDLSDLDPKILALGEALAARPDLKEVAARNTE